MVEGVNKKSIKGIAKGLIFDYDGTIAQTQERQFNWFRHWGTLNGNPELNHKTGGKLDNFHVFFRVYNQTLAENGSSSGAQKFYEALDLPCNMSDFSHPVWEAYREFNRNNPAQLYPGIKEALLAISELNREIALERWMGKPPLILGINSTNEWKTISRELEMHGLGDYFGDFHVTKEDLAKYQGNGQASAIAKPSPISLDLCMRKMGLKEPKELIHIGDTLSDLQASHNIYRPENPDLQSMITIGVAWGYEGLEKLKEGVKVNGGTEHFRHLVDKPEDLPEVIRQYL